MCDRVCVLRCGSMRFESLRRERMILLMWVWCLYKDVGGGAVCFNEF